MLNTLIHTHHETPVLPNAIDRRHQASVQELLWDKLNLSQQYAVCSLGQFGYILTFVRAIGDHTLAILKQNDKIATINEAGIINVNAATACRAS